MALSIKTLTSHVFSFTGVHHEAMQAARFTDDRWEDKASPLFMILSINIHDF
jgi:hypothetical protein